MTKAYPATFKGDRATEIILGDGAVLIGLCANFQGMPAITFTPAAEPGVPGEQVSQDQEIEVGEGSVILAFKDMDAILQHLERIRDLVDFIREHRLA